MAKPGSERQMQYVARQKKRDKEAYLKKRREQKARQRAALKKDKVRYEALKAKDRERKRQSHNPSDNHTYTKFILHYSPVAWKGCLGFQKPFHKHRSRRNRLFQRFCPIFHRQAKEKFLLLPGNQHRLQVALLQVLSRTRRWLCLFWNVPISVIANQVGEIQFIMEKTKTVRRCINQNTTCYGALKKLLTCLTMNMTSILPTTIYRNCSNLKSAYFYLVNP